MYIHHVKGKNEVGANFFYVRCKSITITNYEESAPEGAGRNFIDKREEMGWNWGGKEGKMTEERRKKYEEFARLVEGGMKRGDAYRQAFGRMDMDGVSASKRASEAMKKVEARKKTAEIQERVDAMRAAAEVEGMIYSKVDCMRLLTEMVRTSLEEGDKKTAIRGIDALSKMAGYNEAQRVEVADDGVKAFLEGLMDRAGAQPLVRQRG